MFLHITVNELCAWPIILHMIRCFSTHCTTYDIISLTSLKITQTFHLLLSFAENKIVLWDFKIQNSIWITEGSDNGDSDK